MTAIGVCGHRHLADPPSVGLALDSVFLHLADYLPLPFTVYSSLAEGTDRLAAQKALEYNHSLLVPLPMPEADYIQDFATPASREEFRFLLGRAREIVDLPAAVTRPEAYLASGRYILDCCRFLIAVWDGQPGGGLGGTADIVTEARQRGLPLAWVKAERAPNFKGLPALVTFERFPP